jgi:hypothetical protein
MATHDKKIHPSADPHPGKRGRSGMGALVIALIIAAVLLAAFLVYDTGWRTPPSDAVTPENEPAETEAPSGTEPAEPAVPELADPDAPVETDPPADAN